MQWMTSATIDTLKLRAKFISNIRDFFKNRGYLEVETPIMAEHGVTDVHLTNIKAKFRGKSYSLQTSPEYHMKRLLASGSGPIFQIARSFRDDELGRWHNPEFTLLEWYQLDIDYDALIDEMDLLLQTIMQCLPLKKISYTQAFVEAINLDPFIANIDDFKNCLNKHDLNNVLAPDEIDRDQYLFLLMSHVIEPYFANEDMPIAIYDFPISQASLSKPKGEVAERFEIYFKGIELANGFSELTDANVLRKRFEQDLAIRSKNNLEVVQIDEYLLKALEFGLPKCSGVALGLDRLLAIALNQDSIAKIMAFDFSRA
jgi:lysyl-tRNA synthetase class 2